MQKKRKFLVVIERPQGNLSAYVPDLPGCGTTGRTRKEVLANMRKTIDLHLEGMLEDGLPIPVPTSEAAERDVAM
ncbi:MAG: type II toxin-antitoxin system HicB family antitoxin [Candidatus Lambdaproteobacteria bacterium]|nr:type II toxin-antitoxin system HicB family antitoxin [Candidatus Lambdaproteobacteria bacterium]